MQCCSQYDGKCQYRPGRVGTMQTDSLLLLHVLQAGAAEHDAGHAAAPGGPGGLEGSLAECTLALSSGRGVRAYAGGATQQMPGPGLDH